MRLEHLGKCYIVTWAIRMQKIKIKSVIYSSQGRYTGQLDFCN